MLSIILRALRDSMIIWAVATVLATLLSFMISITN